MKRFNIPLIAAYLDDLKQHYGPINESLTIKRDDFGTDVVGNILKGYNYVNMLLESQVDLFNPAGQYSMLELNHLILCGDDPEKRIEYHNHIAQTRERFFTTIKPILDWYERNKHHRDPYEIALGFYLRALSQPQLFFEGNHRTENIILNYILAGFDKPPFVINSRSAYRYFESSSRVKHSNRSHWRMLYSFGKYKRELRTLFGEYQDPQLLMN